MEGDRGRTRKMSKRVEEEEEEGAQLEMKNR